MDIVPKAAAVDIVPKAAAAADIVPKALGLAPVLVVIVMVEAGPALLFPPKPHLLANLLVKRFDLIVKRKKIRVVGHKTKKISAFMRKSKAGTTSPKFLMSKFLERLVKAERRFQVTAL